MKNKYKYSTSLFLLLSLILISQVSASENCDLSVTMVNQDSYPATQGEYVDVLFQISGIDNSECTGAYFELVPSYPFSVDSDEELIHKLEGSTWVSNSKTEWMIPITLRVDSDAIDANSTISVKYGEERGNVVEEFDIKIEDLRTDFDAVIQDSSSTEISIAIANIGKYTANSVVVRVPEQDNFKATSTDGQMVGNLDSGDYAIVNFDITAIPQRDAEDTNNFDFDIYYTDSLGERRIVNMELNLNMNQNLMNATFMPGEGIGMKKGEETSNSNNNWIWYIVVIAILGAFYTIYKKIGVDNLKKKFKKNKKTSSSKVPTWITKENSK